MGGSGSAYGYAYAGLGEIIAWIIGWALMLEYGVAVSAVAIGWSGYFNNAMQAIGIPLPRSNRHSASRGTGRTGEPSRHGHHRGIDLPAVRQA